MKPFFFFFALLSLAAGSLWGLRKSFNRLIIAWSAATGFYLINFSAAKNPAYMLPLMMPLFLGAMLFPSIVDDRPDSKNPAFLKKPLTRKILWAILLLVFLIQFVINCSILLSGAVPR